MRGSTSASPTLLSIAPAVPTAPTLPHKHNTHAHKPHSHADHHRQTHHDHHHKALIYSTLLLLNLFTIAAAESTRAAAPQANTIDFMCFSDKNSAFVPHLNIARNQLNLGYIKSPSDFKEFIVKAFPTNLSAAVERADHCNYFAPPISSTNLCPDEHHHARVIFQPMVTNIRGTMEAIINATIAGCAAYDIAMEAESSQSMIIIFSTIGGVTGLLLLAAIFALLQSKLAECRQRATPQGTPLLAGAAAPRIGGSYGAAAADATVVVVPTAVAGKASATTGTLLRSVAGFFNSQTITGSRAMTASSVKLEGPQGVAAVPAHNRASERQGLLAGASLELAAVGKSAHR